MIHIHGTTGVKPYSNIKKKAGSSSASGAAFTDILSTLTSGSESASDVAGPSSSAAVGGLLSLQEVSYEEEQRKKAIQHGNNLLQSLESLRHSLLLGAVPPHVLATLEQRLAQQRQLTMDPELHAIIDDIELRAAVELAKYQQRQR